MPRINTALELEETRSGILAGRDPRKTRIAVCAGASCEASANGTVICAFQEETKKRGLDVEIEIVATGCHGFCERGPQVVVYPEGICYQRVCPGDVPEIFGETVLNKRIVRRLVYSDSEGEAVHLEEIPFYRKQQSLLLKNNRLIDPGKIEDYLAQGGYGALARALTEMRPEEVLEEIKLSKLRGRGGGGFPAGAKWETARRAPGEIKYVIVNGHEGEPGAFMDRALFMGNPHGVLEGLIIGGYAVGAREGFIYTRHDSPRLKATVERALAQAEEYGFLGKNILNSGFDFQAALHLDVGIFVSGESSALMKSIEGKTPEPRSKYVRTSVSGVWERPSCLNNVETWANVPLIIGKGAAWYNTIGTEGSKGTKLVSLSGNIANAGVVEVPLGTTLREIVYGLGGGAPGGRKIKAVHFGGPMGGSLPERLLDTPLDFDLLDGLGAPMGAGGLLIMDEEVCMVGMTRYFLEFLSGESCGKCVPCREGIRQMLKVLRAIEAGEGKEGDIATLEKLAWVTGKAALCALGKSAAAPLLSTLRYFREEYEAGIDKGKRPL